MEVQVEDVHKVLGNKEEIIGLQKAINDTVNYLASKPTLVSHWFSTVSV
jgi:hypothetical protein